MAYVNGVLIQITVRNPNHLLSTKLCHHRRVALPNCRHISIYLETSFIICEFAVRSRCSMCLTRFSISLPAQMDWRKCASSHSMSSEWKLTDLLDNLAFTVQSFTGIFSMAASFYASPLIGATTTLACFAHEIPHEIADYSILIRSGFTKRQAMQSQFITAIGAFVSNIWSRTWYSSNPPPF